MSLKQHSPNGRFDRPNDATDAGIAVECGSATESRRSDADRHRARARMRTERLLLRARVEALERELDRSRTEKQHLIDQYEALLSKRRSRAAERARTEADFGCRSRDTTLLERARDWLSRGR